MKKVFCWGTFDRLHKGHIEFLKDAKSKGDSLTVIVVSDKNVFENKRKFPRENQKERIKNIRDVYVVDEVICVGGDDYKSNFELISELKPEIFVFGYDQNKKLINKIKEYLTKKGIVTEYYISEEFANGIHTSNLK